MEHPRIIKLIFFILFLFLLFNFISENTLTKASVTAKAVYETTNQNTNIFFCPRHNCEKALADFLETAVSEINCAFFDLDLKGIVSILEEKSKEIKVRVIVDKDNYEAIKDFRFIRPDNSSRFMHNKFCVVDKKKVVTGSMNPTENGARLNNNNIAMLESINIAKNYNGEFEELWNNMHGRGAITTEPTIYLNGKKHETYFCPEDKCSDKIIQHIRNANKSIYFMTFSFTHPKIATELILKIHEGVKVKGIFEKSQNSRYSKMELLKYQGADVKFDKNKNSMHHKVFVIDNKLVITGSFNPSINADLGNDENILIIEDENIAAKFLEEFRLLY